MKEVTKEMDNVKVSVAFSGEFRGSIATDKLFCELVFVHSILALHTRVFWMSFYGFMGNIHIFGVHFNALKVYQLLTTE